MRTRLLIELDITHRLPLKADGETIAQLAGHGVTTALDGDDRELLATGRLVYPDLLTERVAEQHEVPLPGVDWSTAPGSPERKASVRRAMAARRSPLQW